MALLCFLSIIILTSAFVSRLFAQQIVEDAMDSGRRQDPYLLIPYGFRTEMLSTGIGLLYLKSSDRQRQQSLYLTSYYTSNSSYAVYAGMKDRQVFSDRLFLNPQLGITWNTRQRFYGDLFVRGVAGSGSNESDERDFLSGEGTDSYIDLGFRYLLPIGAGASTPLHVYRTDQGILIDGATNGNRWNPARGGRTFIELKPFYQKRTIDVTEQNVDQFPPTLGKQPGDTAESLANGIGLKLEYDNRDFSPNPAIGSHSYVKIERDFGALNSSASWTALEGSFAKYFDIGETGFFRQRVVAIRAWAAYVPTWRETEITPGLVEIEHRPPSNRGANLGGARRMRAYPRGRFNDKAAIYYSAELRLIPEWNPLASWPLIRRSDWRWWQWVAFAELGRVAPTWGLGTLHENMQWDIGIGARAMIGSGVGRVDVAWSDESLQVVIYVGQSF